VSECIKQRKTDHLSLCADSDVTFREKSTLLNEVHLVHQALPELSWDDVDPSVELLGRRLAAPIYVSAMTGGTAEAERINRDLAIAAQRLGLGMGLGSQRPMLADPACAQTYMVRDVAPDVLLFGNIGIVQARELSSQALADMVGVVGADALCVHLNPAMELVQPGGDRDFRRGEETLARLVEELPVPVVVKEVGTGVSARVAEQCRRAGVEHVDVAGAGGTSWVAVETLRANAEEKALGEVFWDWGIPTAASLLQVRGRGLTVLASGGLRDGLDMARALALGASAAGLATPALQAQRRGGARAVIAELEHHMRTVKTVMFLCGCADLRALWKAPRFLGEKLSRWAAAGEVE
jgi:isopentenyl-diphosphate delta-isomerase